MGVNCWKLETIRINLTRIIIYRSIIFLLFIKYYTGQVIIISAQHSGPTKLLRTSKSEKNWNYPQNLKIKIGITSIPLSLSEFMLAVLELSYVGYWWKNNWISLQKNSLRGSPVKNIIKYRRTFFLKFIFANIKLFTKSADKLWLKSLVKSWKKNN